MGGDSIPVHVWIGPALLIAMVALVFWAVQLLDLMSRADGSFRGRYDKAIWAGILVLTGLVGAVLYAIAKRGRQTTPSRDFAGMDETGAESTYDLRMALRKAHTLEQQGALAAAVKELETVALRAAASDSDTRLVGDLVAQLQRKLDGGHAAPRIPTDGPDD